MKKAFEILAFTLLELVIYILLLSGFYYLFCSIILANLGNQVPFLQPSFWQCLVRFTPSCSIFTILLLIFSFIRRNCTFTEMIIPYAIISILVWFILIPVTLYCDSGMTSGFIDWTTAIPDDAAIKEMFVFPGWTAYLLQRFELFHNQLVTFANEGPIFFNLQYVLFFVSLTAIGCFARFSSWRLWNVFFVIFAFAFNVVLNSYLFDVQAMSLFGMKMNEAFANLPQFLNFLKMSPERWASVLPIIINAMIFLLYTLFGVFSLIGSARRGRR